MSVPILTVKNLSKKYLTGDSTRKNVQEAVSRFFRMPWQKKRQIKETNVFWALKDLSFELERGDVLGIIGKNGAGKSTLLHILSEITPPTTGSIIFNGKVTSILEIGTGFHPDLSGRENIYLNGTVLGMSKQEINKSFDEIVDFSGIESFIDTPVKHYSSGMYLRLAFSIFAHLKSEILLLDEVLAVGDAAFRMKCAKKIETLASSGITIIMVSHSPNEVMNICNKCLLLENGQQKAMGSPMDVMEGYIEDAVEGQIAENVNEALGPVAVLNDSKDAGLETKPQIGIADKFKLDGIKVHAVNKGISESIYMADDIAIVIDFEKVRSENTIETIVNIADMSGSLLIVDSVALRSDFKPQTMSRGKYTATCTIPKNLLNRGVYIVGLTIAENTVNMVGHLQNVLHFKVLLNPKDQKNIWNDKITSSLRPHLAWYIQKK